MTSSRQLDPESPHRKTLKARFRRALKLLGLQSAEESFQINQWKKENPDRKTLKARISRPLKYSCYSKQKKVFRLISGKKVDTENCERKLRKPLKFLGLQSAEESLQINQW